MTSESQGISVNLNHATPIDGFESNLTIDSAVWRTQSQLLMREDHWMSERVVDNGDNVSKLREKERQWELEKNKEIESK